MIQGQKRRRGRVNNVMTLSTLHLPLFVTDKDLCGPNVLHLSTTVLLRVRSRINRSPYLLRSNEPLWHYLISDLLMHASFLSTHGGRSIISLTLQIIVNSVEGLGLSSKSLYWVDNGLSDINCSASLQSRKCHKILNITLFTNEAEA